MSYTFTLSGRSSTLSSRYHPPINLESSDDEYVLGLLSFESYNTIPNIEKNRNNKFYYGTKGKYIEIPEGTYEIDAVSTYLQRALEDKWSGHKKPLVGGENSKINKKRYPIFLSIKTNNNTLKCNIKCTAEIDFTKEDSIGSWLGFKPRKLEADIDYESDFPVDIFKVNTICIECNIVGGSYVNERQAHILYDFFPTVPAGFKIVENPRNMVYLPINTRVIDEIVVKIVDQDGELVNFKEELVSLRLHLKKQKW